MHKYIEWMIDVKGEGNCSYHAVLDFLGREEDNHTLVCQQIKELKTHKKSYTTLYLKKKHFNSIHESHIPCVSGLAAKKTWTCLPEMGHLIASAYSRMCIDIKRYGFSEMFFHFEVTRFKIQPNTLCVLDRFQNHYILFKVYLKLDCPISQTST